MRTAIVRITAALALAACGVILLMGAGGPDRQDRKRPEPGRTAPAASPALTKFRDPRRGFEISYPASWERLGSDDPQVPLLVSSRNGADALLVRVTPLGLAVGKDVTLRELPALRPLTDRLVRADRGVRLLQPPARIKIGGLPGYAYVYTGGRGAKGKSIAHVHYFLFSGPTLIALVFQVAPAKRVTAAGPALARIAGTFKVAPAPAPGTARG